jgi:hypothetical protein
VLLDPGRNKFRFLVAVVSLEIKYSIAPGIGRPQLLFLLADVVLDNGVGHVKDRLCRAVILLEKDDLCVGKMHLEFENVADIRLAETVDRLRIVADNTDILLLFGKVID